MKRVYIQIIGAVCPYEMPLNRCRKVLISTKSSDEFDNFRPATVVNVDGRLRSRKTANGLPDPLSRPARCSWTSTAPT